MQEGGSECKTWPSKAVREREWREAAAEEGAWHHLSEAAQGEEEEEEEEEEEGTHTRVLSSIPFGIGGMSRKVDWREVKSDIEEDKGRGVEGWGEEWN